MDRLGFFKHGLSSLLEVAQSIVGLKHAADSFTEAVDEALSNIKTDIGLHLPSLDAAMYEDPQGTICDVAEMGYTLIEVGAYSAGKVHNQPAARIRELADGSKLKIIGAHINKLYERPVAESDQEAAEEKTTTDSVTDSTSPEAAEPKADPNAEWWRKALEYAKTLGCSYVTMSRLPDYPTDEVITEYVGYFNLIGALAAEQGMQFCFHPRKVDMLSGQDGAPSAFTRLATECDAEKVAFQLDTCEAMEAGVDVIEILKQYAGRVPLLHIHDYGTVGESGKIDFEKIIAEGIRTGVKEILLEVSSYSLPPKNCVERSLQNVQNLPSIRF